MFTLEQIREFTQTIDDYVNNSQNSNDIVKALLSRLEKEFSKMFQKDTLTNTGKRYFTFKMNDNHYILKFEFIGSKTLRMFCINQFKEKVDAGGLTTFKFSEITPAHEFIYHHCNPKGVLMLEKILFEEII